MPQIPLGWFECVFYVYPTRDDAESGARSGGTGFLVGIPSQNMPFNAHIYAVTNRHLLPLIDSGDSVFVRFNKYDGEFEIMELPGNRWLLHPDGDDVAICEMGVNLDRVNQTYISTKMFLTDQIFIDNGIGPGDQVYMIGRFQGHEGENMNIPAARFGYLSQLFAQDVRHPFGLKQISFLVEMRSLSGYSGSPVFAYLMPYYRRDAHATKDRPSPGEVNILPTGVGPWLIGIDWGHLHSFQKVLEDDKNTPETPPRWIKENSGMTLVIPIDRITDLLNDPDLTERRIKAEAVIAESNAQ